ncbi:hypothetical protein [Hippea alviniae]|uniref:hypothetical protein n=1 Tax=Hippea alviniae TaxID=1279027 RepID=UPI0003B6E2BD|nr:hypothetical protein [Hippea alviniae]
MRYIQLTKEDFEKAGIPFNPKTFYRWAVKGKYPEMFSKIGGRILLDVEKFYELVEQNKLSRKNRVYSKSNA